MEAVETETAVDQARVADIMSKHLDIIEAGSSILEAAQMFCERHLRHIIVVDDSRRPVGVISMRDVLQYWVQRRQASPEESPWGLEVSTLIMRDPVTVAAEAKLRDVATLLARRVVGCIPVVDSTRRLIGVLHMGQLLKYAVVGGAAQLDRSFEHFRPGGAPQRHLPAYFRRSNGSLVLPVNALGDQSDEWKFAKLGYDAANGRILLRLSTEQSAGGLKLRRTSLHGDGEYLVIDTNDFVSHFNIDFKGRAYNIIGKDGAFVLMPRS